MSLNIVSFNNNVSAKAQNALFKAMGHPLVAEKVKNFFKKLRSAGPVSVYDPGGYAEIFNVFYPVDRLQIENFYVQKIEDSGKELWGKKAKFISELADDKCKTLLIADFRAQKLLPQLRFFLPKGIEILTFDDICLPEAMLSSKNDYLNPLNFATNFGLLREEGGVHTRISIINYWTKYGAKNPKLWLRLYDGKGRELATWEEDLAQPGGMYHLDSAEIRKRFGLKEFNGSLYMHALDIAGHDILKYVVDIYGDEKSVLASTHDANSWPADFYAGLPVLRPEDEITVWLQNSHPIAVPAGTVKVKVMGEDISYNYDKEIPAFGCEEIKVSGLVPARNKPFQLEIDAGKYFVRPRYEIKQPDGQFLMAHLNVERTDLKSDPAIAAARNLLGKGYILPMPILPLVEFDSIIIPTPMATSQQDLPLFLRIFDGSGEEVLQTSLGNIKRNETLPLDIKKYLSEGGRDLKSGYGHIELSYDFDKGAEADGWLHAIGHYRQVASNHRAETSFGAHIYNMLETFKDEPQSYAGKPPGLTTRLYLRLGNAERQFSQIIYPVSKTWLPQSSTDFILHSGEGKEIEVVRKAIPMGGSIIWYYDEIFSPAAIKQAGGKAYVVIRDATCRLFGYHGLKNEGKAFALDHMFGC